MFKQHSLFATGVAILLTALMAPVAFAGGGGGPTGDGIGVTRSAAGSILSIVDPARDGNPANYDFSLFGAASDTLVSGDWNGDGTTTFGVVRSDGGDLLWIRDLDGAGNFDFALFGTVATDTPVVGDFDPSTPGDEIGITRANNGALEWILRDNTGGANGFSRTIFGAAGDTPVPGNWDANASNGDELGVTRSSGGGFLLWITQGSAGTVFELFGAEDDTPIPGDYTGDGNTDYGVRLDGTNVFALDGSSVEFIQLGDTSDSPYAAGTIGQP